MRLITCLQKIMVYLKMNLILFLITISNFVYPKKNLLRKLIANIKLLSPASLLPLPAGQLARGYMVLFTIIPFSESCGTSPSAEESKAHRMESKHVQARRHASCLLGCISRSFVL